KDGVPNVSGGSRRKRSARCRPFFRCSVVFGSWSKRVHRPLVRVCGLCGSWPFFRVGKFVAALSCFLHLHVKLSARSEAYCHIFANFVGVRFARFARKNRASSPFFECPIYMTSPRFF